MEHQPRETLSNGLPQVRRLITTHDQSGKAIYSDAIAEESQWQEVGGGMANFSLGYSTREFPVNMNVSEPASSQSVPKDIQSYEKDLNSPPGLSIENGTVCRFVDFAPNCDSVMHRTESLDYGVVLEGTMELELDSGEKRIMNRGDMCVQRATNHAWKNISVGSKWARMMFVLVAAEKVVIGEQTLSEDIPEYEGFGGMKK